MLAAFQTGQSEAAQTAREIAADIDAMMAIYPEGVDMSALRDYYGVKHGMAKRAFALASASPDIAVIARPWAGQNPAYLWRRGARACPYEKLSTIGVRLFWAAWRVAAASDPSGPLRLTYFDLVETGLFPAARSYAQAGLSNCLARGALAGTSEGAETLAFGGTGATYRIMRPAAAVNPRPEIKDLGAAPIISKAAAQMWMEQRL